MNNIFKGLLILCICGFVGFWMTESSNTENDNAQKFNKKHMKLKITFSDKEIRATLFDNPTARDFVSMLPLTTTLEDYANNEKIFYPKRKLSKEGAPRGYEPSKGDITYYAPWGDVAIFYKDFSYSSGLIGLGKIDGNGIDLLLQAGKEPVTFELITE